MGFGQQARTAICNFVKLPDGRARYAVDEGAEGVLTGEELLCPLLDVTDTAHAVVLKIVAGKVVGFFETDSASHKTVSIAEDGTLTFQGGGDHPGESKLDPAGPCNTDLRQ